MKNDLTYKKLLNQLKTVSVVSPQKVGPLTGIYKKAVSQVKTWPVKVLLPIAFLGGIAFQILFGEKIVKIVSILQYGY